MPCVVCGTVLNARRSTKRYCSKLCKHRAESSTKARRRAQTHELRQRASRLDMPVDSAAWLAGIVDGEGTVSLSHGGGNRNPHLRIAIYNTSEPILVKVRRILAAADVAFYEKRDTRAPSNCSTVLVGTEGTLRLYESLRPHLTRQVGRLDAAVQFLAHRYVGRSRVSWTAEDLARWENLRAEYNQR